MSPRPPLLARLLLRLLPRGEREFVAGDLEEEHAQRAARGERSTSLWFWGQVLGSLAAAGAERARMAGAGLARGGWGTELRAAGRSLARSPGFSALTAATLALGIAAVTATFTVVNQVVLQALPVEDQDRLVVAWHDHRVRDFPHFPFTWRAYQAAAEAVPSFASVAAHNAWGNVEELVEADDGGPPEALRWSPVLGDFFGVLGVEALRGRTLEPADDVPGAARVVVISEDVWARRFGRSSDAVGATLRMRGVAFEVVGVLPADFDHPGGTDVWTPHRPTWPEWEDGTPRVELDVVARLRPGATPERAAAELEAAYAADADLAEVYGEADAVVRPFQHVVLGDLRPTMLVLFLGATLVLAVATLNVANLVLVRATGRRGAVALRRVLGAGRWRLGREALAEGLLLGLLGGLGGALLAPLAVGALLPLAPPELPRVDRVAAFDPAALAVAASVTTLVVALVTLLPVLRAERDSPASALRGGPRVASSPGAVVRRRGVMAAQAALAVWVTAVGALAFRSFRSMQQLDPGFRVDDLTLVALERTDPSPWTTPDASLPPLADRLEGVTERVARHPGIAGATPVLAPPFAGIGGWLMVPFLEGQGEEEALEENPFLTVELIQPDYFAVMGIPVLQGRGPSRADDGSAPPVVWVNASAARLLWPGEPAVGQRIGRPFQPAGEERSTRVAGVVADTRWAELTDRRPGIFIPLRQVDERFGPSYLLVRAASPDVPVLSLVRDAFAEADPSIRPKGAVSVRTYLEGPLARPRFASTILTGFAAVVLLLAAVGVYGVMSATVRARTNEMGVRIACGAAPGAVLGLVLRQGLLVTALGALLGLALAAATGRLLDHLLFGILPADPLSLTVAAALVLAGAAAACWLPARRAAGVDPALALRSD